MSQDAMKGSPFVMVPVWVLENPKVSDRAVRLYAVLRGYLGDKEEAWPLQATLAKKLDCGLASLKKALKELVDIEAVVRRPRYRSDNSSEVIGCWYTVIADDPKITVANMLANPSQHSSEPLANGLATELDTLELDTGKSRAIKKENGRNEYPPTFEAFWKAYPRHREKDGAFLVWQKRVDKDGVNPDLLVVAATHYELECTNEGREQRFIKLGETFLGPKGAWKDHLPEAIDPATLEQAKAWDEWDRYLAGGDGVTTYSYPEPSFPRPQNSEGNLLDGEGRAYYRDPMQPTKRRYFDDE